MALGSRLSARFSPKREGARQAGIKEIVNTERRLMTTNQELKQAVGKQVRLDLAPQAIGGPTRTGRIVGILEAADGMVVTLEPDEAPGSHVTYHAHHIKAIHPA